MSKEGLIPNRNELSNFFHPAAKNFYFLICKCIVQSLLLLRKNMTNLLVYIVTINITQKYSLKTNNHINAWTEITEASKIHYISSKDKDKTN